MSRSDEYPTKIRLELIFKIIVPIKPQPILSFKELFYSTVKFGASIIKFILKWVQIMTVNSFQISTLFINLELKGLTLTMKQNQKVYKGIMSNACSHGR